jgi:hypothetical protein
MSKIFKKEYLTENDTIDFIQNTVDDILRERTKKFDALGLKLFSQYGYSRDWIFDPTNQNRVSIICIGGNYLFRVDKCDLFSITEKLNIEGDTVTTTYDIKYLAPFPEDIDNG